jgi:hypothetical protein
VAARHPARAELADQPVGISPPVTTTATTVFVAVVLARFVIPLFIPKFPLPAILAALVLDAADQSIFQAFTDDPMEGYQTYDKALDVYYLAIAYISSMRNWSDPVAFQVSRFLYLYRLVGVTAFELLDQRWLLFVFPNTFEYYFIAYEAIRTRWDPRRLSAVAVVGIAAFIWVFIKLPQEWWIHIAQLDFTDFMADYPWMWGVLALAAATAAGLVWHYRRRIPAADWPFTVDVDAHLDLATLDRAAEGVDVGRVRQPIFTAVLAEKVLMLALISVIFAQVLPDVRSTNLQLMFGVAVLVIVNAAVTEWLHRRGHWSWGSTTAAFVAVLVINVGLVTIDSVFGSVRAANSPRLNTLFFVLLLSLLIALFDRFRAARRTMQPNPGVIATFRAEWRASHQRAAGG